jgi:hypothetical protein
LVLLPALFQALAQQQQSHQNVVNKLFMQLGDVQAKMAEKDVTPSPASSDSELQKTQELEQKLNQALNKINEMQEKNAEDEKKRHEEQELEKQRLKEKELEKERQEQEDKEKNANKRVPKDVSDSEDDKSSSDADEDGEQTEKFMTTQDGKVASWLQGKGVDSYLVMHACGLCKMHHAYIYMCACINGGQLPKKWPPCPTKVQISHDALRMRARRLCEKKGTGRCGVPDHIHSDYMAGGESREILEMALLQCLSTHGVGRHKYKKIKAHWLLSKIIVDQTYIINAFIMF